MNRACPTCEKELSEVQLVHACATCDFEGCADCWNDHVCEGDFATMREFESGVARGLR